MTDKLNPTSDSLLIESEQRYRDVIENASDIIQSVRPDGRFEFVNKAWHDTLGYDAEEVENLIIWDIIHPDSVEECQVHFSVAMSGTPLTSIRATFLAKDGTPIPVEGSAQTRFLDGEIMATHSFFRDISARLRAEELQSRNEQLEREQEARYLEKMAALGKLSAGLSHELNNPAAAAQRAARTLTETLANRDAAAREMIDHQASQSAWDRLEALVNQCVTRRAAESEQSAMQISRLEDELLDWLESRGIPDGWNFSTAFVQGGITSEGLDDLAAELPKEVLPAAISWIGESLALEEEATVISRSSARISELIGAVKDYSFRDRAIEQDVDIHDGLENTLVILAHPLKTMTVNRSYDRSIPPIRTYGSGLNQVWTNILDNAVDATEGDGTVEIRTFREGPMAVVEIRDDGPGIPPENISRLFEPFFTTKPQGEGTGLGMDIAWRIVTEEHGGEISVESVPGSTTFRVKVPICPDVLASEESTSSE